MTDDGKTVEVLVRFSEDYVRQLLGDGPTPDALVKYACSAVKSALHAQHPPEPEIPDTAWLVGTVIHTGDRIVLRRTRSGGWDAYGEDGHPWQRANDSTVEILRMVTDFRPIDLERTYEDGFDKGYSEGMKDCLPSGVFTPRAPRISRTKLKGNDGEGLDPQQPHAMTPAVVELIEAARKMTQSAQGGHCPVYADVYAVIDAVRALDDGERWMMRHGWTDGRGEFRVGGDSETMHPATLCWRVREGENDDDA